ncbi:MAG: AAA family ATPase [Pseudomonadota bacterium]|nr:AAA family ATPase [Pseudomonadota bacterium]
MERARFVDLVAWLKSSDRKPLVIRGARQVGKTWLVRQLAEISNLRLIEFNFEDRKEDISLFRTNDPQTTMREIAAARNIEIQPQNTLLFMDEIQAAPELLAKLRWFAEKMPELAVIATGSLLDFALENHSFSMPVGRIGYFYLEPLSFEEFLVARQNTGLFNYIEEYTVDTQIPEAIHDHLMSLFKEYMIIGGLPAAVSSWSKEHSLSLVNKIHNDLVTSYRDDFGKYRGRLNMERLENVMISVPKQLAQKFIYQSANQNAHSSQLKHALELLNKARVSHQVLSSYANGVPLAAETNDKYFKEIFIDVGLCCAQLGLTLADLQSISEINLINKGGIAEQSAGQILRTVFPYYIDPTLYCWMRTTPGANSEVDYMLQHQNKVIPIEVKAGTTGSLKSLHYFMSIKEFDLAVRINSDYPSVVNVNSKNNRGGSLQYILLSLPFYLVGQIHRLIDGIKY